MNGFLAGNNGRSYVRRQLSIYLRAAAAACDQYVR